MESQDNNSSEVEEQTPPSPVLSSAEIADACHAAEVAIHAAVTALGVAVERAVRDDKMRLASVLDARAALCARAANMMGLSALSVKVELSDAPAPVEGSAS